MGHGDTGFHFVRSGCSSLCPVLLRPSHQGEVQARSKVIVHAMSQLPQRARGQHIDGLAVSLRAQNSQIAAFSFMPWTSTSRQSSGVGHFVTGVPGCVVSCRQLLQNTIQLHNINMLLANSLARRALAFTSTLSFETLAMHIPPLELGSMTYAPIRELTGCPYCRSFSATVNR